MGNWEWLLYLNLRACLCATGASIFSTIVQALHSLQFLDVTWIEWNYLWIRGLRDLGSLEDQINGRGKCLLQDFISGGGEVRRGDQIQTEVEVQSLKNLDDIAGMDIANFQRVTFWNFRYFWAE